jgi:hypothetical protein
MTKVSMARLTLTLYKRTIHTFIIQINICVWHCAYVNISSITSDASPHKVVVVIQYEHSLNLKLVNLKLVGSYPDDDELTSCVYVCT